MCGAVDTEPSVILAEEAAVYCTYCVLTNKMQNMTSIHLAFSFSLSKGHHPMFLNGSWVDQLSGGVVDSEAASSAPVASS